MRVVQPGFSGECYDGSQSLKIADGVVKKCQSVRVTA